MSHRFHPLSRFKDFLVFALAFSFAARFVAGANFPTAPGSTWEYRLDTSPGGDSKRSTITTTIAGAEKIDGRDALRFETRADGVLQKTEWIVVDDSGVFCLQRTIGSGTAIKFDPPQQWWPAALKFGAHWELVDEIAGKERRRDFTVNLEDDIIVPAGKFHTFLCEAEEPWPISVMLQRWFSPGIGLVKEVTTTRGPTGRLLSRRTMELQKFTPGNPEPAPTPNETPTPTPSPTPPPGPPVISLVISAKSEGSPATEFRSDTAHLYLRWRGENLSLGAKIRVVWIAEDVGDLVAPNFVIDDTEATVQASKAGEQFTLSAPSDGWAPGKYRAELYLDDKLMQSLKVTIKD